jgi:hypothetical protein
LIAQQTNYSRFTIEQLLWEKNLWFRIWPVLFFWGITGLLVWFIFHRLSQTGTDKTFITNV